MKDGDIHSRCLTPLTIVVFLAGFAIWRQVIVWRYSPWLYNCLFLAGAMLLAWRRGCLAELRIGLLGRLVPFDRGWRQLAFWFGLTVLTIVHFKLVFATPTNAFTASAAIERLLLAPIMEDPVFRGLVLAILLRYLPTFRAVALSALVFAGAHIVAGLSAAMVIFLFGMLVGYCYEKTGSLVLCMLCHSLWNAWDFVAIPSLALPSLGRFEWN